MRLCSVEGCNRVHRARGYCANHYNLWSKYGNPEGKFGGDKNKRKEYMSLVMRGWWEKNGKKLSCTIEGCSAKHYARGYCRIHYARWLHCGDPMGKKYYHKPILRVCPICQKEFMVKSKSGNKYCSKECVDRSHIGERNIRWNGGTADYPNHSLMKRNRLVKLLHTQGKCEACGRRGEHIHHKDGSKTNHSMDNLILLCAKCHGIVHANRTCSTSKYKRIYGKTAAEMASCYGGSTNDYHSMHRKGTLENFLKSAIDKMPNP